jgi:DNA-binding transcriptional LysR family regulator
MELRHLRYFVAVAEELHFGRAAARLHMTQPPLSKQIQALERELGVELFVRGRSIALTAAGSAFLSEARRALEAAETAARAARQAGASAAGRVRIGFPATSPPAHAAAALRAYERRFPDTVLDIEVGHTDGHLDALRGDRLDVALVQTRELRSTAVGLRPLFEEPLLLAVAVEHPLACRAAVRPAQLAGEAVILFPRALNSSLHDYLVREVLGRRDPGWADGPQSTTMETALAWVASGAGVSLASESLTQAMSVRGVVYVPFAAPAPTLRHSLAWRHGAAPAVTDAFVALLDATAHPPPARAPVAVSSGNGEARGSGPRAP